MKLNTGTKFKSSVCTAEGIFIRSPAGEGVLRCGGEPVRVGAEDVASPPPLAVAEEGAALVGKRYVDLDSGLELLCTKAGKGALSFDDKPLTLKLAKPLPASD